MNDNKNQKISRVRRATGKTLPVLRGMFICPDFIKNWNPSNPVKSELNPSTDSFLKEWLLREG